MSTNDKEKGVGHYEAGLQQQQEAVVSAHFMHKQNLSDAQLYDAARFAAEALYITPQEVKEKLIPMLKDASAVVIEKRTTAAIERAQRNFQAYGLKDAKSAGLAEFITEALVDDWFRKGPINNDDRVMFRNQIQQQIDKGEPIRMVIPMLPHKMACPLKTRGTLPCMAEAGLLGRLGELTGVVNNLYHKLRPETEDKQMSQFIVVGDGRRFKSTVNTAEETVADYQKALNWWIKELGIEKSVVMSDYEHIINTSLTDEQRAERQRHYKAALDMMNEKLGNLLDPMDVEGSLKKAIHYDPFPEDTNPEGRFVPLFKSTIYNIKYSALEFISQSKELGHREHGQMYREMTRHLFTPYADISEEDSDRIHEHLMGIKHEGELPPTVPEIKEYVRRSMLAEVWHATTDYLALVIADRNLAQDPVSAALPDAIRYSIHAKPGQIALATDSSSSGQVQAWHGTGVIRPSKSLIKLSNDSALNLEGIGAKPLLVRHSEESRKTASTNPDDLMEDFAVSDQPLMYVHPSVEFYDIGSIKQRFSRGK